MFNVCCCSSVNLWWLLACYLSSAWLTAAKYEIAAAATRVSKRKGRKQPFSRRRGKCIWFEIKEEKTRFSICLFWLNTGYSDSNEWRKESPMIPERLGFGPKSWSPLLFSVAVFSSSISAVDRVDWQMGKSRRAKLRKGENRDKRWIYACCIMS